MESVKSSLFILTPGFPSDESDTACLPAVQQFVKAVNKKYPQIEVIIISFQYPFNRTKYNWNGNPVIALAGRNKARLSRLFIWVRAYTELKKLIKEKNVIGILSMWMGECAFTGQIFSKRFKLRHYIWIHGQDARAGNKYVKWIKPANSSLIAISEAIKNEFQTNYKITPAWVVENGITLGEFPKLNTGRRKYDIISVGSLTQVKNHFLFISVVSQLKKYFPSLRCVITGDGPLRSSLQERVNSEGLTDQILFTGGVTHQRVLELLNDSRICLHTSDFEGNSSVLIEALYSGCIVISTQPLSGSEIKNFYLRTSPEELVKCARDKLNNSGNAERVLFNDMESSAEKIIQLFTR